MNKFEVEPWNERFLFHPESGVTILILANAST